MTAAPDAFDTARDTALACDGCGAFCPAFNSARGLTPAETVGA